MAEPENLVLDDKAEPLISSSKLPMKIKEDFKSGKRFGSLRPISIKITGISDLENIYNLVDIKAKLKLELMYKRLIIILLLLSCSKLYSQNIDIRLLRSVYSPEVVRSDDFFRFLSDSEVYLVIGTPAAIATAGLIRHDKNMFRNACVTVASTVVNVAVSNALKYSVNRERPFITYPDIIKKTDPHGPSFPSGHTANAFATATSLSLAYPEWYVIVPSFAYAGTVAYSRMHLGVHYPSDVTAGAVIGAGCAYLTYKVNKLLLKKRKIKPCDCPD